MDLYDKGRNLELSGTLKKSWHTTTLQTIQNWVNPIAARFMLTKTRCKMKMWAQNCLLLGFLHFQISPYLWDCEYFRNCLTFSQNFTFFVFKVEIQILLNMTIWHTYSNFVGIRNSKFRQKYWVDLEQVGV